MSFQNNDYEAVIGLEVHAELQTNSKMFCACQVVDSTASEANIAVCPVCAGMPGVLPVINKQAVDYALRVALALECEVANTSLFARKNYFYPDLPKGYQISQYEYPLAERGRLEIGSLDDEHLVVRITRVHMEEDTGKLTHIRQDDESYSLVDLNRAGVSLLEIVSEPDMHSVEEARAYAHSLRAILRYLGVNSGDMEKGVIRFEANVSIRPVGSQVLGTRVEIKNLNSFRSMERAIVYEIDRQIESVEKGIPIEQQTLGWNEETEATFAQRSKEDAHDYRYFPEPDLPPLVVDQEWVEQVARGLPELPRQKAQRFVKEYGLRDEDALRLSTDRAVGDYFEALVGASKMEPHLAANWVIGELNKWMNQSGETINEIKIPAEGLGRLLDMVIAGEINTNTAKSVLKEMLQTGKSADEIVSAQGLKQISDESLITDLIEQVLDKNPAEVRSYLEGKDTLANWFFGQVMRLARGQANPQVVRSELERRLKEIVQK
jgi:aspartyl-tRNA(Asn)/glutamyl-tRNA(Gln) amidotransferase subunit B